MAIDITVAADRGLAYFRMSGTVDTQAAAKAYTFLLEHPAFRPDLVMLTDTRHLHTINTSFLGIMAAVQRLVPLFGRYSADVQSIVHAPSDVAYGSARMLQQVAEPISPFRFSIHRTEEQALQQAAQTEASFDALEAALGTLARAA